MGFNSVKSFVDSQVDLGKFQTTSFRKSLAAGMSAGVWFDCSTIPGNPVANFYASEPLVAAALQARNGIYHGQNTLPDEKFLSRIMVHGIATVPNTFVLLDYLLYYPFIDMDSTDEQLLDNTLTLPRYSDGAGVFAMLVAQGSYVGGQQFQINYTNHAGTANRLSGFVGTNTAAVAGNIVNSPANAALASTFGPFIPLTGGDRGIRSIQSIQFSASNGGIAALVLVRPLASFFVREVGSPFEREFFKDMATLPKILDGAYLNLIARPAGTALTFAGQADFTWG